MTPAARIQAAIEVLDAILAGASAEKTLTNWARRSRFAGSGDRAAIRDHVFDALRCRRSFAWLGGSCTGRGLMIGALRDRGIDPSEIFTGAGYGPARLNEDETAAIGPSGAPLTTRLDVPDWLLPKLERSLGGETAAVLRIMRARAPVFLRANLRLCTREDAASSLFKNGIATQPHPLSATALRVLNNARKVQASKTFSDGWVEFQDAASQAVVDSLDLSPNSRVLDYCAGGGGKALAMAARSDARIFAHDADPGRMQDIPVRAARAGATITPIDSAKLRSAAPFDLVLCDAPCSGSGAWRRSPEAKWRMTPERLVDLCALQARILDAAAPLVALGGVLAYVTCSMLEEENRDVVQAFLAQAPGFELAADRRFTPLDGGDGFYVAQMRRLTIPA